MSTFTLRYKKFGSHQLCEIQFTARNLSNVYAKIKNTKWIDDTVNYVVITNSGKQYTPAKLKAKYNKEVVKTVKSNTNNVNHGGRATVGFLVPDDAVYGKPNCGVLATSIVTGQNYRQTENWFRQYYSHGNWKGRTHLSIILKAITEAGRSYDEYKFPKKSIAKIMPMVDHDKIYLVRISGHIMVFHKGYFIDNSQAKIRHYTDSSVCRKFVTHIFEIN